MAPWLISLLVAVAISAVSTLLMPRPKQPKPGALKDLEEPTAQAGREICVIFGTMTMKDPNVLWTGDKSARTYKVKV
jgi:hypothetical protein